MDQELCQNVLTISHIQIEGTTYLKKTTTIHVTVHKSELDCLYSRRQFSQLPQTVSKRLINNFSQKGSYAYMTIDTFISGF